jgi:hypothetical protein
MASLRATIGNIPCSKLALRAAKMRQHEIAERGDFGIAVSALTSSQREKCAGLSRLARVGGADIPWVSHRFRDETPA